MTARAASYVLLIALACVAAPSLMVGYDLWRGSREVPPSLKFIVPNSQGYFVTSSLRELWENGPSHIERLFSAAASISGKQAVGTFKNIFGERCHTTDELKDLRGIGIDASRGMALTIAEFNSSKPLESDFVAALPIDDRARFEAYLQKIALSPVILSPPDSDPNAPDPKNKPISIRIEPSQAVGVLVCSPRDPKPAALIAGSSLSLAFSADQEIGSMELVVIPNGGEPPKLALTCRVDYDDGTNKQCKCTLGASDCTNRIEFPTWSATSGIINGLPANGVQLPTGQFLFYIDEAKTALVGSTRQLVGGGRLRKFDESCCSSSSHQRHPIVKERGVVGE